MRFAFPPYNLIEQEEILKKVDQINRSSS